MSLPAPAQAIQAALLADAEALVAAEGGVIASRQIRALAGAVARRLAVMEQWQESEVEGARKELAAGQRETQEIRTVFARRLTEIEDRLADVNYLLKRHLSEVDE